jgi:Ala-tRNA(Pro) deacylase
VKIDDKAAMAVVPASCHVDLRLLKKAANADTVNPAVEVESKSLFPEWETGAMPPFGNRYGLNVFADEKLAKDKEIAFQRGITP